MLEPTEYFGKGAKRSRDIPYTDTFSELRQNGLAPVTSAMVMDKRIEAAKSNDKELIDLLWNNSWTTCIGIAYPHSGLTYLHPNLGLDIEKLRTNPEVCETREEKLLHPGERFLHVNDVDTNLRTYDAKEYIINRDLDEEQARNHKIWLALADNNQERLDSYVAQAFRLGWDKAKGKKGLGVYINVNLIPIFRYGYMSSIFYKAEFNANGRIDDWHSLVGVPVNSV